MARTKIAASLLLLPYLTLGDLGGSVHHVHHAPLHQSSHSSVSLGGNAYAHGQSKSHGGPTVVSQAAAQNKYVFSPTPVTSVIHSAPATPVVVSAPVVASAPQQCTTSYEEQCSTVQEQVCSTKYVTECSTVEKEVCVEVNEQTCNEEN